MPPPLEPDASRLAQLTRVSASRRPQRIACYLYPPTLPGDPSHTTITWPMALQLLYAGVDLELFNMSSYFGTAVYAGRECELWYTGFSAVLERGCRELAAAVVSQRLGCLAGL